MRWIIPFINLLLYGNFWIAAAAVAMSWQTEWILTGRLASPLLSSFIFLSTLFLYAIHRLVGMKRVEAFKDQGRYRVIARYRRHILAYALLAAVGAGWSFWQLPATVQWGVLPPSILSMAYVLPVLGGRRLRDLHYVKIFLIAGVWAWVTVALPGLACHLERNIPLWFIFGERLLFVFAITLPFDIRDLRVDAHTRVNTLPALLGLRRTRWLSMAALAGATGFCVLNFRFDAYAPGVFLALLLSILLAGPSIYFSNRMQHDYYFSGWLDGLMILQFGLVWMLG